MSRTTSNGRRPPAVEFERRHGRLGAHEIRSFPFTVEEVRESGAGEGQFTIRGHAAVFNRLSLDLGGFREKIDPGAFAKVLDSNPDVHHVWDHDTRYILSRTRNNTLELREDPIGLHFWSRVAPTSYAADLRILLERGDIDQSSFMFSDIRDSWEIDENGLATRTIHEIGQLYDVTTTAAGAYPQTDSVVAHKLAVGYAVTHGRLPWEKRADIPSLKALMAMYECGQEFIALEDDPDDASDRAAMQEILGRLEDLIRVEANEDEGGENEAAEAARPTGAGDATSRTENDGAGEQTTPVATPDGSGGEAHTLRHLKAATRADSQVARERYLGLLKEISR